MTTRSSAPGNRVGRIDAYAGPWPRQTSKRADPPASPGRAALTFAVIHFGFSLGFLLNLLSVGRTPYRAGPPNVATRDDAALAAEATS